MTRLGLIGFGEAGYNLTIHMDRTQIQLYAFDPAVGSADPRAAAIEKNAAENQVTLLPSMEALCAHCDILFCLTSARSALPIAKSTLPLLRPEQIYCDLNSASPKTKEEIADLYRAADRRFVEAAIMASVPANQTRVPIYLCGDDASVVADALNPAGMNLHVLGTTYGAASASKMLKSVLFKGFIALLTETVFATDRYGITEQVLDALKHMMLEEMTYEACCNYFVETAAMHSNRLAQEMEEVLATLQDMGENSIMTQATLEKMRWISAQGYNQRFPQRPHGYAEVLSYKHELAQNAQKQ